MYKIEPIETEKSKIPLRKCMKDGVIAKFPSSTVFSGRSGSGKSCLLMNIMMLTNKNLLKKTCLAEVIFTGKTLTNLSSIFQVILNRLPWTAPRYSY